MDKKEKIIQEYLLSKASYRLIAVGSLFELQDNYESKKHMPFRLFTGCVYICFATTVFSQTDVGSNVMTLQAATEILSKTEFNNQTDWDTYPTADYYCDKCKQAVSINFESLTKHQFSDFSNFNSADKELFRSLESDETKTNSFLDFYCPTCKRPVKIYYDSWAGGRPGEAGFTIKFIAH